VTEDKLRKLQAFLMFWFSPWGAAKGEMWEWLTHDRPFDNEQARQICLAILQNNDNWLQWEALSTFFKMESHS
jgi:hypothetical protein